MSPFSGPAQAHRTSTTRASRPAEGARGQRRVRSLVFDRHVLRPRQQRRRAGIDSVFDLRRAVRQTAGIEDEDRRHGARRVPGLKGHVHSTWTTGGLYNSASTSGSWRPEYMEAVNVCGESAGPPVLTAQGPARKQRESGGPRQRRERASDWLASRQTLLGRAGPSAPGARRGPASQSLRPLNSMT